MLGVSRINPQFVCFKQNGATTASVQKTVPQNQDFFYVSVEPPVLKDDDIAAGRYTDEQIAQINQAKRLPDNAKFYPVYEPYSRYNAIKTGEYRIGLSVLSDKLIEISKKAHIHIKDEGIRGLPYGCEVIRKEGYWGTSEVLAVRKSEEKQSV